MLYLESKIPFKKKFCMSTVEMTFVRFLNHLKSSEKHMKSASQEHYYQNIEVTNKICKPKNLIVFIKYLKYFLICLL